MIGHDHGNSLPRQGMKLIHDSCPPGSIQCVKGFIKKQKVGLGRKKGDQSHQHSFATGEFGGMLRR